MTLPLNSRLRLRQSGNRLGLLDVVRHQLALFSSTSRPGGTTDLLARVIAPKMGAALGQTVVAENNGGAGGAINAAATPKVIAVHPSLPPKPTKPPPSRFAKSRAATATRLWAPATRGICWPNFSKPRLQIPQ